MHRTSSIMPAHSKLITAPTHNIISLSTNMDQAAEPLSHSLIKSRSSETCSKMKNLRLSPTIAVLFLVLTSSYLQAAMAGSAFCDGKCKVRCSKASIQGKCLEYCGLCCEQCHCVPSGTYGNKDECPCYRDKTTGVGNRKRPKCP